MELDPSIQNRFTDHEAKIIPTAYGVVGKIPLMTQPLRAAFPMPPTMANGVPAAMPHAPATTNTETAFCISPVIGEESSVIDKLPDLAA